MEIINDWFGPGSWALLRGGLLQLGGALLLLVLGLLLARWLAALLHRVLRQADVEPMLRDFLRTLARSVLSVLVVVGALDVIGVPAASLLAVLGAAGLAIGLALKDSLGNLAAGVMIILLKPFRTGHVIEMSGLTGTVEQIRLMHTVLCTADNRELVFPNGVVVNEPVINYSARDTRRIDLVLGIAYKDEIGRAVEVVREVLARESRILPEPAAQVVLLNLGESSVDLGIRPWVNNADYWPTRSALLIGLKLAMDQAGISIPFPQRELHVLGGSLPAPQATQTA